MKAYAFGIAALTCGGVMVVGSREIQERHSAAMMFAEKCASCHVPPDLAFASERAWLDQIKQTA